MFHKLWFRKVTPKQEEPKDTQKIGPQLESKGQETKVSDNDSWNAEERDTGVTTAPMNTHEQAPSQPPPCWKNAKLQTAAEALPEQGHESSFQIEPASNEEVRFSISSCNKCEQKQQPILSSDLADAQIQNLVTRLRERTILYKEKLLDQHDSSAEETPSAYAHGGLDDHVCRSCLQLEQFELRFLELERQLRALRCIHEAERFMASMLQDVVTPQLKELQAERERVTA
ncbi:cyclic nucleotide-gated cation channel beta-3-like [Carcharodon carcharias]|uniref:cyclic nucleotide-gated cation channel beta-3-like n=1 Tax=Carcharodon carcharias TaxID=13397 RepID=UPI001B7E02CB|nr:cyclic nucleotide-gated cation channel beta-3-like [Carcharodon carcharias]